MNKRMVNVIILITSLALVGIVFMQLFWVKNALDLKEEQFDHRVTIALKSVVNQLMICQPDSMSKRNSSCQMECEYGNMRILDILNKHQLDSLILDEFGTMIIAKDYVYGVFNRKEGKVILGNTGGMDKELVKTGHVVSLTCLFKPESYLLGVYFPNQQNMIISEMLGWLLISLIFLVLLIAGFTWSVISLIKQKRLSEMKADFVNNMTHEFKTPISTISLASEMLLNPAVNESQEKTQRYAQIIFSENTRLKNQVEQVLQLAVLDKGEYSLKKRETDVHKIIENLVRSFSIIVKKRKGNIFMELQASKHIIFADKDHVANVIMNILDNADKYSHCAPHITIRTTNNDQGILISITDKGLGISPENQKEIFRKLYRVPTGNIHNVKGFGLGLYYARTIVEAHHGTISVHSEPKKGSRFDIFFPFNQIISDGTNNKEKISEDFAG